MCQLLLHRNKSNLCVFIVYPMTLLNSLSGSRFFVAYMRFSTQTAMSSSTRDSFISSFLICTPFISFSCLISLAQTSSIMSYKSGERGPGLPAPHLKGKLFSLSWLNKLLGVLLGALLFKVFSFSVCLSFNH